MRGGNSQKVRKQSSRSKRRMPSIEKGSQPTNLEATKKKEIEGGYRGGEGGGRKCAFEHCTLVAVLVKTPPVNWGKYRRWVLDRNCRRRLKSRARSERETQRRTGRVKDTVRGRGGEEWVARVLGPGESDGREPKKESATRERYRVGAESHRQGWGHNDLKTRIDEQRDIEK